MFLQWEPSVWEDYVHWQKIDPRMVTRINEIIRDTMRHPFEGIGKPEPLRGKLKGYWSRRITQEHRLVYRVESSNCVDILIVAQCRYHY